MDSDAKYLKRKVKAGRLDVHPTEKVSSYNYRWMDRHSGIFGTSKQKTISALLTKAIVTIV